MSFSFPQPQTSTASTPIDYGSAASISGIPPSPNSNSYHYHSHQRSHSGSLTPSPTPSQTYLPSPGLIPTDQEHHYRLRAHSHSSDHHHHHHHHQHHRSHRSRSRSHSHSREHSGHGSPSTTPAPPLMISQNSEPVGPYVSVPPYQPPYDQPSYAQPPYAQPPYAQPPYAPQPAYGSTLTPAAAPVPMLAPSPGPTGVSHGVPSPQYPPATGAPFEPPAQSRALNPVGRNLRSHGRQPLVSREMDARQPKPKRHDWRCHPHFKQSRCTGGRKALCIGINYTGQSNPLQGCVDDAKNIYKFLMDNHHYPRSNIIVLTDDNSNPRSQPTRKNILSAMKWLVNGAHADDALFIHYSGHGGRTRDLDGDEPDGWDEVIFPVDYKTAGIITDDVLHNTLVTPLPAGCRLTVVFDSCHSGSILDLNYEFHSNGRLKTSPVAPASQQAKSSPADVICFSGCKDTETSADTVQDGVAVGAMSYAYLKVLKRNPQISYIDLLRGVRAILKKKYSQKPQLSASHELDVNLRFVM